jgi:hypothetical protein
VLVAKVPAAEPLGESAEAKVVAAMAAPADDLTESPAAVAGNPCLAREELAEAELVTTES